jgi:glycosyltransferase involved in cell wall biosynthesis
MPDPDHRSIDLSIVIPCLNEEETLGICIQKAQRALAGLAIESEIVVADNGSQDTSIEIAERLGARVVRVAAPGYGSALMGGITASRGRFVIMGDADDSYDFLEIPRIFAQLEAGYSLVQGCRLPAGGGTVLPGAMPFSHRWIGNPLFSLLARHWFKAPIRDIYCGLRGFTRSLFDRLELRCTGMEFATEMIIKASLREESITEVPITLHPDGRISRVPHLRTLRDGWRTLRFFLLYSPRWVLLLPGLALVLLGVLGYALALPGLTAGGATFDAHTLVVASFAVLCGYQAISFDVFLRTFAMTESLVPADPLLLRFYDVFNLEKALLASAIAMSCGVLLIFVALFQWQRTGFGPLDYAATMRLVVPGATLAALGLTTVFSSFSISILSTHRR